MKHAHLIGIGGSGLSAIARVLVEDGYQVTGSDLVYSSYTKGLEDLGIRLFLGHDADQISGADFILRSSAIPDNNVEVVAAFKAGIPVYKRADFLGRLTSNKQCIAVAGTHGKTTTTAMISWMLTALNLDPSFIIGGISKNLHTNAHAGSGQNFVIEADEYDRMFLGLQPDIAIVTNIEHDHPDNFPTERDFFSAFVEFANRISGNGYLLACADDENTEKLINLASQNTDLQTFCYGLRQRNTGDYPDIVGRNLTVDDNGSYSFDFYFDQKNSVRVKLQVPGLHNVQNSLASLGVAKILGLTLESAAKALSDFQGTERRFEIMGEVSGIALIDDYAHHPTEIRATLETARNRYPNRKIWAVWQPHTYSRTETLFDQYIDSFDNADQVVVTEIFPSREKIREDFSSSQVVQAMTRQAVIFIPNIEQVVDHLIANLVLSAGDANQICTQVIEKLSTTGKIN
jgi:UDP-N-acetylmuramate--alanine ligase